MGRVQVEGRHPSSGRVWVATRAPPRVLPRGHSLTESRSHPDPGGDPRSRIRKFAVSGEANRETVPTPQPAAAGGPPSGPSAGSTAGLGHRRVR